MAEISSSRIVITVLGKNRPGIVAGVTRVLGEANVDIRDITQSIIEDIFTMTMLADTAESKLEAFVSPRMIWRNFRVRSSVTLTTSLPGITSICAATLRFAFRVIASR